jgi:hypothetical protein
VKRDLEPDWSKASEAAGTRHAASWEVFFAEGKAPGGASGQEALDARAAAVLARHQDRLLGYPNVVGTAVGLRTRGGRPSDERCLVVYVQRKVPESELAEEEVLPREVEGVPVDVVEVGRVQPLSP